MKKLLIVAVAFLAITATASAQEKRMHRGHHKKHGHSMMAKALNFSEDQKKQARSISEDYHNKMKELAKQDNITVKEMRDRKDALRKEHKEKMGALLTKEQKEKMAQFKEQRKARSKEQYAKRLDKMKAELNLTDAQVAQLKSQKESMHSKMSSLRDNESLSREQKKEKMMALRAEAKEAHKKIFTEEQLKKMDEMKKNRGDRHRSK